jgi:hypothetical protein
MVMSSAGVVTGVSRGIGTFTVVVVATDSLGETFTQSLTLSLFV